MKGRSRQQHIEAKEPKETLSRVTPASAPLPWNHPGLRAPDTARLA